MRNGHCAIACNPSSTAETSSVVSGVHAPKDRLAEIRERRVRKPPMKPFVPTTPTFVPSTAYRPAMEHRYPASASTAEIVALVRVPVVVPKDSDDRDRERTARVGDDRRLLGLEGRQVAGEQKEIRTALQRGEGAPNFVAAAFVAVNVAHGGDPNQARSRFTSRARRVPGTRE